MIDDETRESDELTGGEAALDPGEFEPSPDRSTAVEVATGAPFDDPEEPEDALPPAPERPPEDVPFDVAFRLTLFYDKARGEYGVRCDELGDLEIYGSTREEALREGEAMLESRIAGYAVRGEPLPKPFDLDGVENYDGQIRCQVSRGLHLLLVQVARRERVSLQQLVAEMLAAGVAQSRPDEPPRPRRGQENRGGERTERPGGRIRGRRGMSSERYNQVMEDKASFLEYVRGLDDDGGPGRGGRGRGRGRR